MNGMREPLIYNRLTLRTTSPTGYSRERKVNGEKFDFTEAIKSGHSSISRDFLKVDFSDFKFLIAEVPKEFGPKWSSNIGIEYRKEWGRIPNEDEREMISELCSFVFGCQLLLIGNTIYDKEEQVVGGYARNPWGEAKAICSKPAYPPININSSDSSMKAEDIIKQMLPKYFELRNPLHLNEALWFYWIFSYTTIGTSLPILWAGIEEIMHGWFKYKNSKSKGVYITKKEFNALLSGEISIIESKLKEKLKEKEDGNDTTNKIVKKIEDTYQMGPTDRLRFFFKEIQLDVNEQEWDSLELRHKFAHGSIDFDTPDGLSWIKKTQTVQTLFNRIFLKVLGYSGNYIDRSTIPWVDKKLN